MPDLSDSSSAKEASEVAEELSQLSKQHWEALNRAIYIRMNAQESAEFEKRRARIQELCAVLGKYKAL